MGDQVICRREENVCELVLNRPQRGNALSQDMVRTLDGLFRDCLANGARLIVFRGEGKHFCTGFDLSDISTETDAALLLRFVDIEKLLQRIYLSPVPTLAVGTGRCFGAGADLFLACSQRIAAKGSSYTFPGPSFGLVLGTNRLAQRIGRDRALATLLEGRVVPAEEATASGLASELASLEEIDTLVAEAARIANRLEPKVVEDLRAATSPADADRDLANLVRSASRPGLQARILRYRQGVTAKPSA